MKKNDKTQMLLENMALFNASLEEFSRKSYFEASTNEILKKSNYNKGSFYYRFSNKADLYMALLDYIIVEQIELFNKRQYNILKSNSLNELLYELFLNLYHLFKKNSDYYYTLANGFNDSEASLIISSNCLEPLYHRFINKFNDFHEYRLSAELRLIIDNLYYHFPTNVFLSENAEEKIKNIVQFTLNQKSNQNLENSNPRISFNEIDLSDNPMFFITKSKEHTYPKSWEELFKDFANYKDIIKKLKKSLGMMFFNYNKAIFKEINSNLKDNQYLLGYLNEDLVRFINKEPNFYYFLVTCFYHSLKETDHLLIDLRNNFFNKEKLSLFYQHILPILSKTSKIILLSDYYVKDELIKTLNLIDNQGLIRSYSFKEIKDYTKNTLIIDYFEEDIIKTEEIPFDNLLDFNLYGFINNHKIIEIKTIYKIYYDDVIQSEVNQ